jgi:hypothetical protein
MDADELIDGLFFRFPPFDVPAYSVDDLVPYNGANSGSGTWLEHRGVKLGRIY